MQLESWVHVKAALRLMFGHARQAAEDSPLEFPSTRDFASSSSSASSSHQRQPPMRSTQVCLAHLLPLPRCDDVLSPLSYTIVEIDRPAKGLAELPSIALLLHLPRVEHRADECNRKLAGDLMSTDRRLGVQQKLTWLASRPCGLRMETTWDGIAQWSW